MPWGIHISCPLSWAGAVIVSIMASIVSIMASILASGVMADQLTQGIASLAQLLLLL